MNIREEFTLIGDEALARIDEDFINYLNKRVPEYASKLSPEEIKARYIDLLKMDAILEYLEKEEIPERKE